MSSGTNALQTDLVKGAVGVLATAVQGGVDRVTVTPASSDTGHIDIRSSNCSATSIPARAICSFRVSNATGKTHVGTMTTCVAPLNDGTTVDEATQTSMLRAAGVALGDTSGLTLNSVSCVGGVDSDDGVRQLSAQELHRRRLASNCGPTFATSNITSINKYSCQYYGEQVDEFGQKGYKFSDRMTGQLASCDEGGFDRRTETDIRELVAYQMDNGKSVIDKSKIRCDTLSVPY